ncbi:hypothetical protein GUJ93_ZPchr0013g36766 [Zizania palustris]|uniref:Uncharacterized protein n=1 Tax=Zizania palustris TaxID=103762 RepID=A0A8J6C609_ZIZPA|nr:hypothetical protein GUJ93_ZPchr0013g36766 [Zizania palustris]
MLFIAGDHGEGWCRGGGPGSDGDHIGGRVRGVDVEGDGLRDSEVDVDAQRTVKVSRKTRTSVQKVARVAVCGATYQWQVMWF